MLEHSTLYAVVTSTQWTDVLFHLCFVGEITRDKSDSCDTVYTKREIQVSCRDFLAVQWLGLWASTAGVAGSIPGREPEIPLLHGTAKNKSLVCFD